MIPFSPFVKDSLICVKGCISSTYILYSSKPQVVNSNNHPISSLIVFYVHVTNVHLGLDLTLNLLREPYSIKNAKSLTCQILKSCLHCKRLSNQPKPPIMVGLYPERRSSFLPTFYFIKVDYFGPLTIKLNKGTRHPSRTAKRYGIIFTYVTTQTVHLKLAGDISTDSFMLSLCRFKTSRGHPESIRRDNGSNFIGYKRELKDTVSKLDEKKIIN